jgi:hypothetical protein
MIIFIHWMPDIYQLLYSKFASVRFLSVPFISLNPSFIFAFKLLAKKKTRCQ